MSQDPTTNNGITGTLHYFDGMGLVRMSGYYDTDLNDLWQAVSDPRRLSAWLADIEGDLHLGGDFKAKFTSGWEGAGRIDLCEPPHRLLVSMWGEGEESTIAAELTAAGDRTKLTVEHRGIPLDRLAPYGAGWNVHVADLQAHLAGQMRGDWAVRWAALAPSYAALVVMNKPPRDTPDRSPSPSR